MNTSLRKYVDIVYTCKYYKDTFVNAKQGDFRNVAKDIGSGTPGDESDLEQKSHHFDGNYKEIEKNYSLEALHDQNTPKQAAYKRGHRI
jgi:hypothetical protein